LPKTPGETLLPQSQDKSAAERQFPDSPPASWPPAFKLEEKVIGQALAEPETAAPEPEQPAAKAVADKTAYSADIQKPEREWPGAGAKPPLETNLSTDRNASPLSLIGKAEDSFSKLEAIDLAKLAQKAEGALAKIAVDQLASQSRDDGTVCLQINLPFVAGNHQDNAALSITSEGGAPSEDRVNPAWSATIQLQPPGMGAFNARIIWNGAQIDACLWSDREETAERIGQATETLRARLEQAGLTVGALAVLDRPPSSPTAETLDLHLLDLLA
jgi:flagellar hook-length control protein FliK